MSIGSRTIFCAHFLQVFPEQRGLLWHFLLLFGRAEDPLLFSLADNIFLKCPTTWISTSSIFGTKNSAAATGTFFAAGKKRKCSSVRKAFQLCAADRHKLSIFVTLMFSHSDVTRRYLSRNLSDFLLKFFSSVHFKWAVISVECRNLNRRHSSSDFGRNVFKLFFKKWLLSYWREYHVTDGIPLSGLPHESSDHFDKILGPDHSSRKNFCNKITILSPNCVDYVQWKAIVRLLVEEAGRPIFCV